MFTTLAPAPQPDYPGLLDCLRHNRRPSRVFVLERYIEESLKPAIAARFDLAADLDRSDRRVQPVVADQQGGSVGADPRRRASGAIHALFASRRAGSGR